MGETEFSNPSFPMSLAYVNWETDAIVGIELIRNIGIALACIFVTTLITLGSWRGSLLVMMCVLLTCTDVAGFMHWWGLTIDMSSMNGLILLPAVLCMVGPSDDQVVKHKKTKPEKKQTPILKPLQKVRESEKYRRENEKNLQKENGELGLPLNPHTEEPFVMRSDVRETVLQ